MSRANAQTARQLRKHGSTRNEASCLNSKYLQDRNTLTKVTSLGKITGEYSKGWDNSAINYDTEDHNSIEKNELAVSRIEQNIQHKGNSVMKILADRDKAYADKLEKLTKRIAAKKGITKKNVSLCCIYFLITHVLYLLVYHKI